MTRIVLNDLSKSYGAAEILHGINLSVESGEFVVFVGPSGSGKSTLLRLICGLEDITSGSMSFDGRDVTALSPSERGVSMVFQSYALYPHMTVFDNLAFGLRQTGMARAEIASRVEAAARSLEIAHLLERSPRQLSGGQRQRVAIGRAIVRDPKVFLFDEPLSNLDTALRAQTRLEIAALHGRMPGTSMIYVTHDQVEAMTLADRICLLDQGRLVQIGAPRALYDRPATVFAAGFIGSPRMNLLNGQRAAAFDADTIGVRPEHIVLDPDDASWTGSIRFIEDLGSEQFLHIALEDGVTITARRKDGMSAEVGQSVGIGIQPGHLHRFDRDGDRIG